jgi:hypothetical protein
MAAKNMEELEEGEIRESPRYDLRRDAAMPVPDKSLKEKKNMFMNIVKQYLESNPFVSTNRTSNELEIRFGTNPRLSRPISKIDYDNVVKQLYACGFKTLNEDGIQILRIQNEYTDPNTGMVKMSNIRAEIVGTDLIQEYCRTNNLQKIIDMPSSAFNKIKFTKKSSALGKDGKYIERLDMDDFNFRVSYQTEQDYNVQSNIARNILSKWMDSKKTFRCLNRVRFYHPNFPIFADLSIVKDSKKTEGRKRVSIPEYLIQDANVFQGIEHYEIELEVNNEKTGVGSPYNTSENLMDALRKCIRIILSGLQGTKFPISYTDRDQILQSYMKLVHGDKYIQKRITPSDFIGPGSYTLQLENILEKKSSPTQDNSESQVPNIRSNYTVTDKADGERKLLYIHENGNIYMIDTNMNVIFTGAKTNEKQLYNSLLDGEYIQKNKHGETISLYAAFDIYFVNKKSVREYEFYDNRDGNEEPLATELIEEKEKAEEKRFRVQLLYNFVELLKLHSVLEAKGEVEKKNPTHSPELRVKCKSFYATSKSVTIFTACSKILSMTEKNDALFEYNTDGLIFTPCDMSVGAKRPGGHPGPLYKSTWENSFKWKPPEFNTIDFLVSIQKDKTGKEKVHSVFQDGRNLQGVQNVTQYKTLVLMCGFDVNKHGFINPCQDILNDKLPSPSDVDNESTYKPMPFQPTNPSDEAACYTNILLKEDGSKLQMMTEEGEYFTESTIVEFKYVDTNLPGWKWVPIRVRYDKTAELRAGLKNYGNAYHVANNNWHSIHHPITEDMISTGNNIPEFIEGDDVYYNRSGEKTVTQPLRDFHNMFVKKNLILSVSKRGDTLIDYAVGKAGDLQKWIRGKLGFVFGIDISKDNIHNMVDGACSRFLRARMQYEHMPRALFVNGNSGLNIRSGQALLSEKDKQITKAVFGNGPKDLMLLGKGVYQQYGVGESGFQISSCQFAMHYFFENKISFHQFLRNLSECTKLNGYFVGTCYDGKAVFEELRYKKRGESIAYFKENRKIYELTKEYDETGFPDDDMSLGYAIHVYQESINQVFREYLVNFEYFTRVMEDYGFVLASKEEMQRNDLPNNTGLFSDLFSHMQNEVKQNPRKKEDYRSALLMSSEEKRISFMNRYFVFKKVRNVDAKKMAEIILQQNEMVERIGEENVAEMEEKIKEQTQVAVPVVRKLKKKLVLEKFQTIPTPPQEELPVPAEAVSTEPVEVTTLQPTEEKFVIRLKKRKV